MDWAARFAFIILTATPAHLSCVSLQAQEILPMSSFYIVTNIDVHHILQDMAPVDW